MQNFKLPFSKAENPVSYEDIKKLRSFDNIEIDVVSNSQILKRLEIDLFSEIIDLLSQGEKVKITD